MLPCRSASCCQLPKHVAPGVCREALHQMVAELLVVARCGAQLDNAFRSAKGAPRGSGVVFCIFILQTKLCIGVIARAAKIHRVAKLDVGCLQHLLEKARHVLGIVSSIAHLHGNGAIDPQAGLTGGTPVCADPVAVLQFAAVVDIDDSIPLPVGHVTDLLGLTTTRIAVRAGQSLIYKGLCARSLNFMRFHTIPPPAVLSRLCRKYPYFAIGDISI